MTHTRDYERLVLSVSFLLQVEKPQTVGLSYNTDDQWEIPKSSLRLIREIGSKCVIPSTGGEAPYCWTVVQHQGPVGDPQEFSTTHTRYWF